MRSMAELDHESLLSFIAVLEMLHFVPDRYQRGAGPWQDHGASKRGKS
jgi:hypothetical protein